MHTIYEIESFTEFINLISEAKESRMTGKYIHLRFYQKWYYYKIAFKINYDA